MNQEAEAISLLGGEVDRSIALMGEAVGVIADLAQKLVDAVDVDDSPEIVALAGKIKAATDALKASLDAVKPAPVEPAPDANSAPIV